MDPPVFRDMYRSNNHRAINPTPSFNNYIVISTALARRVKAPNSSLSISTRVESLTMGRHDTLEQRAAEVRIYKIPLDVSLACQEIGCKLNLNRLIQINFFGPRQYDCSVHCPLGKALVKPRFNPFLKGKLFLGKRFDWFQLLK